MVVANDQRVSDGAFHVVTGTPETKQYIEKRTDTQWLRYKRQFTFPIHFDAQFTQFDDGTGLFTFLMTLFGSTSIGIHNGNPCLCIFGAALFFVPRFLLGWHDDTLCVCVCVYD